VFSKSDVKRKYIRGGKYGKIEGFDFYFTSKEKLFPFQRRILIKKGNEIIEKCIDDIQNSTHQNMDEIIKTTCLTELDSNLSDEELKDIWNPIYNEFGYLMDQFFDKWFREKSEPTIMNQTENSVSLDINSLKQKIGLDRFQTSESSTPISIGF
jgi:hypothetical protein